MSRNDAPRRFLRATMFFFILGIETTAYCEGEAGEPKEAKKRTCLTSGRPLAVRLPASHVFCWIPKPKTDGYQLHFGTQTQSQVPPEFRTYTHMIDFPNDHGDKVLDIKLEKDKSYYFALKAYNTRGTSKFSTEMSPPTIPMNLGASSVGPDTIALSWSPSKDDQAVIGYWIYRDGLKVGESPSPEFIDSNLLPDTIYTYTVQALDAGIGTGPSHSDIADVLMVKTLPRKVKTIIGTAALTEKPKTLTYTLPRNLSMQSITPSNRASSHAQADNNGTPEVPQLAPRIKARPLRLGDLERIADEGVAHLNSRGISSADRNVLARRLAGLKADAARVRGQMAQGAEFSIAQGGALSEAPTPRGAAIASAPGREPAVKSGVVEEAAQALRDALRSEGRPKAGTSIQISRSSAATTSFDAIRQQASAGLSTSFPALGQDEPAQYSEDPSLPPAAASSAGQTPARTDQFQAASKEESLSPGYSTPSNPGAAVSEEPRRNWEWAAILLLAAMCGAVSTTRRARKRSSSLVRR